MKIRTSFLLFFLTFSSAFLSAQESSTISSDKIITTITIDGMACQEGCADTIAENLNKTEGIVSALVSYETGKAIVQFDNSLITINKLKQVITETKVKDYVYVVKEFVIKNDIVK